MLLPPRSGNLLGSPCITPVFHGSPVARGTDREDTAMAHILFMKSEGYKVVLMEFL